MALHMRRPSLVAHAIRLPLPIGEGQTISQPSIVALMAAALRPSPTDRVLEIGTGSGYATAVLHGIVREVYTVERLEILYRLARRRLRRLGYHKVAVHHGNGTLGWPAHAPYDGIVVTAGGPTIPVALQEQLALGGRLGDAGGRPAHAAEACARDTRQCRRVPARGAGLCMLCATDWRAGMGRRHGSAAIWRGRTPTSMKHWHRASESIQQRWQR